MKFLEMLSEFFMTPIDKITEWLDQLQIALDDWWSDLLVDIGVGVTSFMVEGVAVCVVAYAVYCAFRIICTNKDEKFSEYLNKSMVAWICYFFAKCGGTLVLRYLGV